MQQEQIRREVTTGIFQSLSESDVQIRSIPSNELQAVVNALADGVLAALAAVEEEADNAVSSRQLNALSPTNPNTPILDAEEQLLWRGRPYLTIGTVYELTTQRIRILRGLLGNTVEEIELVRVKDTQVKQHLGERILDVGDVSIFSSDASMPEVTLHNVRNPIEVRELIRMVANEEKQRRGLRYREDLA